MPLLPQDAVLLMLDIQKGFDDPRWGCRNNPQAEENAARLLAAWRAGGRPVIHFQHSAAGTGSPLYPGTPGWEIKDIVKPLPGEPVFHKRVNSCFIGTGLEAWLREHGYGTLVIVGLTTANCVSTTARMAANLGFKVYVVADASAAYEVAGPDGRRYSAAEVHRFSLAVLHCGFATIVQTQEIL